MSLRGHGWLATGRDLTWQRLGVRGFRNSPAWERGAEHPQVVAGLGLSLAGVAVRRESPGAPSPLPACCWWPWLELFELGLLVSAQLGPAQPQEPQKADGPYKGHGSCQEELVGTSWGGLAQNISPEHAFSYLTIAGEKHSIILRGSGQDQQQHPGSCPQSCDSQGCCWTHLPSAPCSVLLSQGQHWHCQVQRTWGHHSSALGNGGSFSWHCWGSFTPSPAGSLPGSLGALMGYPRGTPGC